MRGAVGLLLLAGCVGEMKHPPTGVTVDTTLTCDDSRTNPIGWLSFSVAAALGTAFAATYDRSEIASLLGLHSAFALFESLDGFHRASRCEAVRTWQARERLARDRRRENREQAGALWKQAAAAARADDCASVRELSIQVRDLDPELHTTVFRRDVAIERCLVISGT